MSVGTLITKAVLDEPGRIHCGSDTVTGHVSLVYRAGVQNAGPDAELFGPLRLSVVFHGRSKTKVWKSNGQSTHIYRGRARLFSTRQIVFDDAFRAKAGATYRFPFQVRFPATTEGPAGTTGHWDRDPRFTTEIGHPLPPSFCNNYRGFAHHFESFVEYRVGVVADMLKIDVAVHTDDKYSEPIVLYEQPQEPKPIEKKHFFSGIVSVKNELLLPEGERPSGFRQKAKYALGAESYPTYTFDWICSIPQHWYIGSSTAFEIRITPKTFEDGGAIVIPEIKLVSLRLEIRAMTQVRAEKQFFTCPESSGDDTIAVLDGQAEDGSPFSKANDWTKVVTTRELNKCTSTFKTYNISQAHSLIVNVGFNVTGKLKNSKREYPIVIHSPLQNRANVAGPSSANAREGGSQRRLDMSAVSQTLPKYDAPPGYEEATVKPPAPVSKDETPMHM